MNSPFLLPCKRRKGGKMNVKRCKHGMIEEQCGVCKKWEQNCWEKKEEKEPVNYKMENRKEAQH
jgi:hypothetical protein